MTELSAPREAFENALMPPVLRVQLVREHGKERLSLDGPNDAARILCDQSPINDPSRM